MNENNYTGDMTPLFECGDDGVRFTLITNDGMLLFSWTMSHFQAMEIGQTLQNSVDEWERAKCQG